MALGLTEGEILLVSFLEGILFILLFVNSSTLLSTILSRELWGASLSFSQTLLKAHHFKSNHSTRAAAPTQDGLPPIFVALDLTSTGMPSLAHRVYRLERERKKKIQIQLDGASRLASDVFLRCLIFKFSLQWLFVDPKLQSSRRRKPLLPPISLCHGHGRWKLNTEHYLYLDTGYYCAGTEHLELAQRKTLLHVALSLY